MTRKGKKEITDAIRLVWESLESHLDAAAGAEIESPCCNEAVGKPPFHKRCVKEYAFVISVLAQQL